MGIAGRLRAYWRRRAEAARREKQLYRLSPIMVRQPNGVYDLAIGGVRVMPDGGMAALAALGRLGASFSRAAARRAIASSGAADPRRLLDELIAGWYLLPTEYNPFRGKFVRFASIQTTSHCNARCRFCPVSTDPKPPRLIEDGLFADLARQIKELSPRWVALNITGEPLLHPRFLDQARLLADLGMKLMLFSNGILLAPAVSQALAGMDVLFHLIINVPTLEAEEYRRMMGVSLSPRLRENVAAAVETGTAVQLCVNGLTRAEERKAELEAAFQADKHENLCVALNTTHSHAGTIDGDENRREPPCRGRLRGCRFSTEHLTINVEGKVLLCCEDYFDRHVLGDARRERLRDILDGPVAEEMRRKTFGDLPSGEDFICRRCFARWRDDDASPLPAAPS